MPGKTLFLAPTFDHAASLGAAENNKNRVDRLTTRDKQRDMSAYVKRAKSAFFDKEGKRISTVEAFRLAAKKRPKAAPIWLAKLRDTSVAQYYSIFKRICMDLISPEETRFALEMLRLNRERMLEAGEVLR
ncbi:MAG: hypothetical protein P4L43_17255 [Syntrophobacteraceae bacterium]|nr:hypothetical protein [Syntrophobacteraceae bacterium]